MGGAFPGDQASTSAGGKVDLYCNDACMHAMLTSGHHSLSVPFVQLSSQTIQQTSVSVNWAHLH